MKNFSASHRLFCLLISTQILASCASQSSGNYSTRTPIPIGSHINASILISDQEGPDVGSRGEEALGTAGEGAVVGAGAGLYGGLQAGVACGPLAYICSPALGVGMAAAGAILGGVAGGAMGAYRGLPGETAEQLEKNFADYINSGDLASDVDNAFASSVGTKWNITEGIADTLVEIRIYQLGTEPISEESISFQLVLGMQLRQSPNADLPTKTYLFEDTQSLFVTDMLADEGANIRSSLQAAFLRLSNQMVMLLEQPPRL